MIEEVKDLTDTFTSTFILEGGFCGLFCLACCHVEIVAWSCLLLRGRLTSTCGAWRPYTAARVRRARIINTCAHTG